jgi:hypothetical protein
MKITLLLSCSVLLNLLLLATAAYADCPYGAEQCLPGYVWRGAFDGDKVCVTGTTQAQVAEDNRLGPSRKAPNSNQCVQGFVWREASEADQACVTGTTRNATRADNLAAPGRVDPQCKVTTIKGNISFAESSLSSAQRAASNAEIELWVCGTWFASACSWSRLSGGKTDDAGNYQWLIAGNRDVRDQYQVRVYARNSAAIVWQQDTVSNFWTDVSPSSVAASATNPVVNISRHFGNTGSELFASMHLNAATKLLAAREFALRFRDGSETDTLGRVIVSPAIVTGTAFTNSGVIHVNPNVAFDDRVLVHEYGHFVQESIGAYYLWPSEHDGCFIGDHNSPSNSAEFAWFEGFPEFFSMAVRMYFNTRFTTPVTTRTIDLPSSYVQLPCGALGMQGANGQRITPEAVESRVTDMLFLLMNDSGPPVVCQGLLTSAVYRSCATPIWDRNAKLVMSIIDKELDYSQPNPVNVYTFTKAWLTRGGSRAQLAAALTAVGMTPPVPPPPPASPHDVCVNACNDELSACKLTAHTGQEMGQCAQERTECTGTCPP